jgi:lipopolysaccharide/colanic/teichoic acid biosynthesis glycosyltransferase
MKRALDLLLVLLAAPIVAPVLALLALAVLLTDGRPVFFTQTRVGRGRRLFRVFKLRTMTSDGDPRERRVTVSGAWLRPRGLDELPQLLNVLLGDMSLVGPRPLTPEDVERLTARYPAFGERFEARPGLTGLAQVCRAEGIIATTDLEAFYARRQSIRMDAWILLRTFGLNVVGRERRLH